MSCCLEVANPSAQCWGKPSYLATYGRCIIRSFFFSKAIKGLVIYKLSITDNNIGFQFGCSLVDCFLKSAQINVNLFNNRPEELILPAFYHTYEFKVNKKLGVLKPHPVVCKLFKEYLASQGEISMETTSVPMLVPPRPWRATKDGAYLILPGLRTLSERGFRE